MMQLLGMPGLDSDGEVRLDGHGIPHCDWFGGQGGKKYAKCPDWRLHEANTYGFRAYTATCDYDENPFVYEKCNRDNTCRSDILANDYNVAGVNEYGPNDAAGVEYNINTLEPFHVKTEFHQYSDTGKLAMYTVTLR